MAREDLNQRLSRISTLWSDVGRAHQGDSGAAAVAQERLLERYGGAIRRYLRAAVRDAHAAEELFQEFAVRFLQGRLRGADPQRGRFRDFVKGVLHHMVADYHQGRKKRLAQLPADYVEAAAGPEPAAEADDEFVRGWREELLARCWAALAEAEAKGSQPFYSVLHLRAKHPGMPSEELARQVGERIGRTFTAVGVRQVLHRARERFADLLIAEVADSLRRPTADDVAQELCDLGLLDYCRPRLASPGRNG
jgi:RNA polymerase sigma-70 factor (ECF subfamily)